jgi:hypothetical protein
VLLNRLRAGVNRFFDTLDSEGVGIFQAVVYLHAVTGGLYLWLGAASDAIDPIEESLGKGLDTVWMWLCLGPAVCLIGKVLCWYSPTKYAGMLFQLSGDLFAFGVFSVFVVGTMLTTDWGNAVWGVFIMAGLAECVALLIIRDLRRIGQVEQIKAREVRSARRRQRDQRP